ncbi:MAG: TMEM43 family protein [Thermoanaerobaculia bacterium]|nr:TMEM43 family protein [Thermoanaerobaculia bacterium]
MAHSVSVTSNQSWFSRLAQSAKSVLVGLVLFVASFPLLFWNEGRAVRTARSLAEGAGAVRSVAADAIDSGNEGKLVHASGPVTLEGPVVDDDLGVEAQAIKLIRNVEIYQWKEKESSETQKKLGGGSETVTTYTYDTVWSEEPIDSSSFEQEGSHQNHGDLPFLSTTFTAEVVHLGAFELSPEQIAELDETEPLRVDAPPTADLSGDPRGALRPADGGYYLGANPQAPEVGDVRIRFEVARPATLSVVGVQTGNSFAAYQAAAGDSVLLVDEGTHTAAEMFQAAQAANSLLTWVLRVVGWLLMFLGLLLIFKPIAVFGDVVPIVGSLLGAGIGLFSFLLASGLALITVAIAWLVYRPLLGLTLLLLAGAAIYLLVRRSRQATPAPAPTTLPPLPPLPPN